MITMSTTLWLVLLTIAVLLVAAIMINDKLTARRNVKRAGVHRPISRAEFNKALVIAHDFDVRMRRAR